LSDYFILFFDILGISVMGYVGALGMKYFIYILRTKDLENLRYIWVPIVMSGGFFFTVILILSTNDIFGNYVDTSFYFAVHPFLLVGSVFFALSTNRFVKTVRSHKDSKKQAEVTLEQMQQELAKK